MLSLELLKKYRMSKTGAVNFVIKNIGYVLLVVAMGLVYIFNANKSERKLRRIQALKIERQDVHDRYMQLKQEVMQKSTASELDKDLKSKGLERRTNTPTIINKNED